MPHHSVMRRARPLRQPHRKDFFYIFRGKLGKQANDFCGFVRRSGLQGLEQALNSFITEPQRNVCEEFAIFAESAVAKTVRDIEERGLGHQAENIGHAVGDLPAAEGFFDKFRQTFFSADARAKALRGAGALGFDTLQ